MKWYWVLLVALLPLTAQGAWIDQTGKVLQDTESMRSAGEFGVQIVLTADEEAFRQTWHTAKTPPKLSTTNTVRMGVPVSAMLIFHGCAANTGGVCDVASEFVLEAPDGKKTPAGHGSVWTGRAMPQRLLQLSQTSMTISFDKTDPMGDYKITANIKDKVSGRALAVTARLKVTP